MKQKVSTVTVQHTIVRKVWERAGKFLCVKQDGGSKSKSRVIIYCIASNKDPQRSYPNTSGTNAFLSFPPIFPRSLISWRVEFSAVKLTRDQFLLRLQLQTIIIIWNSLYGLLLLPQLVVPTWITCFPSFQRALLAKTNNVARSL